MRISRAVMFIEMAKIVAMRSTCFRLNVGAVVTAHNRVVSIGYNGTPPGAPHCAGNACPGAKGCKETTHAEVNALLYVPGEHKDADLDLYVTDSPCHHCSIEIAESNVRRVFFNTPYRITTGLEMLIESGVKVYRVLPGGYVIDWATNELVDAETL